MQVRNLKSIHEEHGRKKLHRLQNLLHQIKLIFQSTFPQIGVPLMSYSFLYSKQLINAWHIW